MTTPLSIFHAQQCPRLRFLADHDCATGNEPSRISVKDAVDRVLKPALSRLISGCGKFPIEEHIRDAAASYALLLNEYGGLRLTPQEDAHYVIREQGALIEAMVRAADRVLTPDFAHVPLITMPESRPLVLSPTVTVETAPDLILEYENGRCGLFWMITGTWGSPNVWMLRHAIVSSILAFDLGLVEIRYIRKGERRQVNGVYVQHSDLIRGIKHEAKRQRFYRPDGVKATGHVNIWEQPLGLKGWIDALPEKIIGKSFGLNWAATDPTDRRLSAYKPSKGSMSLVQMISTSEIANWKRQVATQEAQIQNCLAAITAQTDEQKRQAMINAYFVQFRHSCNFCDFNDACDRGVIEKLAETTGIFRRKP